MSKVHVKVDDTVYVRTGKDRAKVGKVLRVLTDKGRVIVEGVNIVKKHQKPDGRSNVGGIVEREGTIAAANVMLVCEACKRPTKVGRKLNEAGDKVRYCKSCDAEIDVISKAKKA